MRTYGAGLWLFGQLVDRYASDAYGPPVSTLEAIARAGQVEHLSCLDVNYPFTHSSITVPMVRDALGAAGLRAHAITPHLYTRRFQAGSFTNPDQAIRDEAVDLCLRGVEVARELGASYLKFWPGQDGHDYPFQANYTRLWDLQLDGVRRVVEAAPDVQFAIEYKLKEPRNHMSFSTVARTLLGIEEIGAPNLGIVLDFGHSLFAKETPADALELAHRYHRLVSVELNDNLLEWDDDMAVGSVHPMHTLEFLVALRRIGWDRPILLDQFPFREDPVTAANESIRTIEAFETIVDRMDLAALADAQERQDAMAAQALVLDELLPRRSPGLMTPTTPVTPGELASRAQAVRRRDLEMVYKAKLGHLGGEFSATDILVTLYLGVLHVDPARPDAPDRDRFVLSKGHGAAALYSTLAEAGFIGVDQLSTFMEPLSLLNGHPDRNKVPGVETNTGPLGHGLPVGVGMALGARMDHSSRRVFVLTGDGELQEGSMWEAAMAAGHFGLDNLVAIVDRNGLQQGDATERTIRLEPLADKWRAFGWAVREVDGHDHAALLDLFAGVPFEPGKPNLVIAHTHKGRGVSFMTDRVEWHHRVPSASEIEIARRELGATS